MAPASSLRAADRRSHPSITLSFMGVRRTQQSVERTIPSARGSIRISRESFGAQIGFFYKELVSDTGHPCFPFSSVFR
jgi:hypothetical protein